MRHFFEILLSPTERVWLADILALVCLVAICACLYFIGDIP